MDKELISNIIKNIQINVDTWNNILTTNCYAYSLGIDISENKICSCAYQPGVISNHKSKLYQKRYIRLDELISAIESDLKILNLDFKEININDAIKDNEWKIALCLEKNNKNYITGFHFIRCNPNGIWKHKPNYYDRPIDISNKKIDKIEENGIIGYTYEKCYKLKKN